MKLIIPLGAAIHSGESMHPRSRGWTLLKLLQLVLDTERNDSMWLGIRPYSSKRLNRSTSTRPTVRGHGRLFDSHFTLSRSQAAARG